MTEKITKGEPQSIGFKPTEARYVRIYATRLDRHTELGTYLIQLSELEVYAGDEDLTPPTGPSTPTGPSEPSAPSAPSDPTGSVTGSDPTSGNPTGSTAPIESSGTTTPSGAEPTGGADTGVTGSALPLLLAAGGMGAVIFTALHRRKAS